MTREDLKQYRYAQKWIDAELEKYQEQRTRALNISQNLDGMPKAQNKVSYSLENLLDQYNQILKILEEDQKKQNAILLQLRDVKEPYRTILTDKYILGMSLEEISADINYSYYEVCRMHGTALTLFDKKCEEEKEKKQ